MSELIEVVNGGDALVLRLRDFLRCSKVEPAIGGDVRNVISI